jgi:hypothetical protein
MSEIVPEGPMVASKLFSEAEIGWLLGRLGLGLLLTTVFRMAIFCEFGWSDRESKVLAETSSPVAFFKKEKRPALAVLG